MFGNGAALALLVTPFELIRSFAVIAAGVGLEHAGIDGEAFALHEPHGHCRLHDALEDVTQDVAVAEAPQPID